MSSSWQAQWDENEQAYYYYNTETDETTWDQPEDYVAPTDHESEHHDNSSYYSEDAQSYHNAEEDETESVLREWRLHPEHDQACTLEHFQEDYGEDDAKEYWQDALPMRPNEHGVVLTEMEFMEDLGDEDGAAAFAAAPTEFDPDSISNFDADSGRDLSADDGRTKVNFWREKRKEDIEKQKNGTTNNDDDAGESVGYSIDVDDKRAIGLGGGLDADIPAVEASANEQSSDWMECWDQTHQAYVLVFHLSLTMVLLLLLLPQ